MLINYFLLVFICEMQDKYILSINAVAINGNRLIENDACMINQSGVFDVDVLINNLIGDFKYSFNETTLLKEKVPVIITPKLFCDVLLTLNEALNADNVLRKMSPLSDKIGNRIFDEKFTLIDDGTLQDGLNTFPCDDEGVPMSKNTLIYNGTLVNFIHSIKTAARLNSYPTGNGLKTIGLIPQREFNMYPSPSPTNWIVPAGASGLEDIIGSIKEGIIIDSLMGLLMFNLLNGDFGGTIDRGYKIEKGKIVGRLAGKSVNLNIYDIFRNNVVDFSKETKIVHFMNAYNTFKLPYVLLRDIKIF